MRGGAVGGAGDCAGGAWPAAPPAVPSAAHTKASSSILAPTLNRSRVVRPDRPWRRGDARRAGAERMPQVQPDRGRVVEVGAIDVEENAYHQPLRHLALGRGVSREPEAVAVVAGEVRRGVA